MESLAVTRYDNRTLAAAALHREMTVAGKESLKKIGRELPKGTEATINILMCTDVRDSSTADKVYLSAAILLSKSQENRFFVKATLAGYEVPYSDTHSPHALTYQNTEKAAAQLPSSKNEIVVERVPLISSEGAQKTHSVMHGDRAPIAKNIMEQMLKIFSSGVPIPANLDYHWANLQVMVHQTPKYYEIIYCAEGARGLCEGREEQATDGHRWGTYWAYNSHISPSSTEELKGRFVDNKAVAEGEKRDEHIPPEARLIGSLSLEQGAHVSSIKNHPNDGGKVEEIP